MKAFDNQPAGLINIPKRHPKPKRVGTMRSGSYNNGNALLQAWFGSLFYISRKTHRPVPLNPKTQRFDLD
jgi:hypothetical protein